MKKKIKSIIQTMQSQFPDNEFYLTVHAESVNDSLLFSIYIIARPAHKQVIFYNGNGMQLPNASSTDLDDAVNELLAYVNHVKKGDFFIQF